MKNKFIKDTGVLTIGVVIAQIIPIFTYPILSRLYTPEQFGILASLLSVIAILSILSTLKYEDSILIAKSKLLVDNLVALVLGVSFCALLIFELFFLFFGHLTTDIFRDPNVIEWLWICPIAAFFVVIFNCFNEYCVKNAHFKFLSANKIINGASIPLSKILFSFFTPGSTGLILGEIAGKFITGVACVVRARKINFRGFKPSWYKIKYLFKRYSGCPKFLLPGALLNKVAYELPVFVLMSYFSAEAVGYYSMAMMVVVLPSSVISRSVRDTFRKAANDIYVKQGSCTRFYLKVISVITLLSVTGYAVLFFIAPYLFTIVLGEEWFLAGKYAQILCPMIAFSFVSQIGGCMYYVAEKMNLYLRWEISYFVLTITGLAVGVFVFSNVTGTLICLAIGRSLSHILNIILAFNLTKKQCKY